MYAAAFGPNPPPTHGHAMRSFSGSRPSIGAYPAWIVCGAWCDTHIVSPPSSGMQTIPLFSIGTPARR